MKYYESTFDEYILSLQRFNAHSELIDKINALPKNVGNFKNTILYGPAGVGKYTQALNIIRQYSKSNLKYDKKLFVNTEKNEKKKETREKKSANSKKMDFINRISDVHYEVDMSILGCNSKALWHEIFFKIVDIVSVKQEKVGIILCKNMHHIYNELLDVFYSFINHPLQHYDIKIHFILLTEHISFLPDNVLQSFELINVKRPSYNDYLNIFKNNTTSTLGNSRHVYSIEDEKNFQKNIDLYGMACFTNIKEIHILKHENIPVDVFNVIVDKIILKMTKPNIIDMQSFRNDLYDILIYDINPYEFICHIVFYFIENDMLDRKSIVEILIETFTFFKYYNNNYRPIYHLESIIFFIINKIHFKRYIKKIL
jgi:DNA polymerase III delta prime subunit